MHTSMIIILYMHPRVLQHFKTFCLWHWMGFLPPASFDYINSSPPRPLPLRRMYIVLKVSIWQALPGHDHWSVSGRPHDCHTFRCFHCYWVRSVAHDVSNRAFWLVERLASWTYLARCFWTFAWSAHSKYLFFRHIVWVITFFYWLRAVR